MDSHSYKFNSEFLNTIDGYCMRFFYNLSENKNLIYITHGGYNETVF